MGKCRICGVPISSGDVCCNCMSKGFQNENQKIPRVEISKKGFKKPTLSGLDKYLIFSFTVLILFTIAILITFLITHEEPVVLVGCFFAAFASEVYHCAKIKKLKLHKETELMNKNDNNTFT